MDLLSSSTKVYPKTTSLLEFMKQLRWLLLMRVSRFIILNELCSGISHWFYRKLDFGPVSCADFAFNIHFESFKAFLW